MQKPLQDKLISYLAIQCFTVEATIVFMNIKSPLNNPLTLSSDSYKICLLVITHIKYVYRTPSTINIF